MARAGIALTAKGKSIYIPGPLVAEIQAIIEAYYSERGKAVPALQARMAKAESAAARRLKKTRIKSHASAA